MYDLRDVRVLDPDLSVLKMLLKSSQTYVLKYMKHVVLFPLVERASFERPFFYSSLDFWIAESACVFQWINHSFVSDRFYRRSGFSMLYDCSCFIFSSGFLLYFEIVHFSRTFSLSRSFPFQVPYPSFRSVLLLSFPYWISRLYS